jgi:hypothetical protein
VIPIQKWELMFQTNRQTGHLLPFPLVAANYHYPTFFDILDQQ